ncbi:IclR family transcriptional regulator [Maritalea myrionectae]|uniref:IclR family transcriptional regulator n=1 Tax=Maritalea myrionectae TaxID=454601 RepID=UPI00040106E8|nr:IclR family transcriptional regulator [Maritalea myrionectae]
MSDLEKYNAPALDKGLDIIETLAEAGESLTQGEIAKRLNRSVSEIFRMLVVLRRRGLIALDETSDRYYLTTRLFELAHRIPIVKRLTVAAAPVMQRLAVQSNQSNHLAVRSADSIVIVGQVDNPGNNVLSVRMGARIEIWRTSSGRVILAHSDPEQREKAIAAIPHPDEVPAKQLRTELDQIATQGYEQLHSLVVKGIENISAPILGFDGFAAAALTIPYMERLQGGVPIEDCLDMLLDAAESISVQLGGPARGPDLGRT